MNHGEADAGKNAETPMISIVYKDGTSIFTCQWKLDEMIYEKGLQTKEVEMKKEDNVMETTNPTKPLASPGLDV